MCAQSCLAFVGAVGPVESLDRAETSVGRSCPRGQRRSPSSPAHAAHALSLPQDDGWRATVSLTDSDLLVLEGDSYTIRLLRDFRVSLSKMVETCLCYEMAAIPGDLHHQHSQLLDILVDLLKGPPGSFGS